MSDYIGDFTDFKGLPCGDEDASELLKRSLYFSFFFLFFFSPPFLLSLKPTLVSHAFFQVPAQLCPLIFQLVSLIKV